MLFDLRWPKAKPDEKHGRLIKTKKNVACNVCGVETSWVDLDFSSYLCSDECMLTELLALPIGGVA